MATTCTVYRINAAGFRVHTYADLNRPAVFRLSDDCDHLSDDKKPWHLEDAGTQPVTTIRRSLGDALAQARANIHAYGFVGHIIIDDRRYVFEDLTTARPRTHLETRSTMMVNETDDGG